MIRHRARPPDPDPSRSAGTAVARRARVMGSALFVMGTLHAAVPGPFDRIIPQRLPGPPRLWTLTSGAAELLIGTGLLSHRTRRLAAYAAGALFLAVWPANFAMATRALRTGARGRSIISLLRLPLQIPLIASAWHIARNRR